MNMDEFARLNEGERWLWKWQFSQPMGGFWTAQTKALEDADLDNLHRLSRAFPDHVEALTRFRTEEGYWPRLVERVGRPPHGA